MMRSKPSFPCTSIIEVHNLYPIKHFHEHTRFLVIWYSLHQMRLQFAKELLDISNQEFGHFHGREMPPFFKFAPVL